MKKTILTIFVFFFIITSVFSSGPCKDEEHEYYKYKCTSCGSLQHVEDQLSGDYAYAIRSDYDEWGEEIGKLTILQTKNAIYRNEYGEEEDIIVVLAIKPTTKSISIGFYETNGSPLYGTYQNKIRYRTGNGNIYNIFERDTKWYFINEVQVIDDSLSPTFNPFISNLLATNKIKVLLGSPARIEFTIEYDNIILSRMLEECRADFFWDALGENIIFSNDITEISSGKTNCQGSFKDSSFYIIIPDSVTEIGFNAFSGCTGLTKIVIPDSVTKIGTTAFKGCTGLTEIIIPDSVTEIEKYFYIEDGVFSECTNLTNIYCEASSQPNKWDNHWNEGCNATIHWGYTGDETN